MGIKAIKLHLLKKIHPDNNKAKEYCFWKLETLLIMIVFNLEPTLCT